jgi:flagellar motor switch protein FliG
MYGTGDNVDYIAATTFDSHEAAGAYIKFTESFDLKDNKWVKCVWTKSWEKVPMTKPIQIDFGDALIELDDRAIQKIMRETDTTDLAMALYQTDVEVQDKIFRNMSKRAAAMLKEDMEYMGPIRREDFDRAREHILYIRKRLIGSGEIVYDKNELIYNEPDEEVLKD